MSKEKQIKTSNWLTKGISKEQLEREKEEAIKEARDELRKIDIEEMAKIICDARQKFVYSMDIAEALYNAGYRKQSEWISVEERLPEKNVRVLVYIKSSRSYTIFDTDRLDDRGFVRWFNDVTHWMPLPEPPKKRKEDEGK